ncbi:pentatricopeptide repeat-containing protein At4g21300 isoform X1 [Rhodamnia argentea]|uniref:Pentatricopeptide repeat-containing protein At4g21300 isoform X1 n=1 Tax=Rhodamnia argentea TaxID=178133 RepID=A0A8B8NN06_9MYRT|nr:pentatricopeptide repeat-containing protein At4g21300 isoform X1 [Rhodamnia argentea]XP_048133345.1 pentatricopeptide repeat-containing protein At4g21300 isoform X1 [Rhodamnia argentea]XP_048133346.1 pentatricopeptide repeat-containing protein At4g21300 isoform X1 [Rhodamnia argentea]
MIVLVMNRKHAILFRKCFATLVPSVVIPLPTVAIPSFSAHRREEETLTGHFVSVLGTCSGSCHLQRGKQVHAQSVVRGISRCGLLGPKLLGMYVLCGDFLDAKDCFYQLEEVRGSAPWNWMIRGLAELGWFDLALSFCFKMLGCGIYPDRYTYRYVIKACESLRRAVSYKLVHGMTDLMGGEVDRFVASSVIKFYAENGYIADARNTFDKMPHKDCVLWNVMLNGYLKNGDLQNAVGVFLEMRRGVIKPNSVTFAGILSVCAPEGMIGLGAQLHSLAFRCGLESDSLVANTLLAMYSKCRCLNEARKLFDLMLWHDVVTWNALISGYVQNGLMGEALSLFIEMLNHGVKPDSVTFSSLLPSITESANLKRAKEVHGYVMRNGVPLDVFLKSALIDVYFKCRNVKLASEIFKQETVSHDVVIYTAMISGYVLNRMNSDAIEIFRLLLDRKVNPNSVTLASILPACAGLATLRLGKELHGYILKSGLGSGCFVLSAITDMYAKCGQMDVAYQIFRSMSEKDVVCWNSMMTNFSQNGKPEVAIQLFREMGLNGIKYDCVSISSALSACASLPALYHGKEIHGYMTRCLFCHDVYAETALIDMYAKCGHLEFARCVFETVGEKNEVSWNSMIAAYGSHGLLRECLSLFYEMQDNGIQPDDVTFLTVMSACGHAGQIDKGIQFFHCMTEKYGIRAKMEHFSCMVDLFGRAGRLDEAFKTIKRMPFSPGAGVWGTLLGACHLYGNVDLAEVASRHLFEMEPENSGYYVLFSNLHAGAGHWGGVLGARSLMKERGVKKVPGCSWIEVDNMTHVFVAADETHLRSAHIYSMLEILLLELRKEGYVTQQNIPRHPQTEGMYALEKVSLCQIHST